MNTPKFAALSVMGTILIAGCVLANPVDLSAPGGELGAANPKGYLEIWREIDGVGLQLGKGSYLPLRYKFSSDPTIGGVLGPGFYLPMFEAKNVLIREGTMRAYLPCGKGLYLWRDTLDPNRFKTPDREWTGYLTGDDFVVWRDDGWKVLYHKSQLTSIRSDDNHIFTWAYDSGGTSVSEDGQSFLTMESNAAGQVAAFVFGGKRYEVAYAERPVTQMLQGQVAIKELDQALSSFKYPDGRTETFNFALTPERVPTVTFTGPDKKQTVYTWDVATSHIATERGANDNWTYNIGDISQDFGVPPISRTSPDGKTEGMAVDNKKGTYTAEEADGTTTVTHVFETPGPLYHKVKFVEQISNGETTTTYRAFYDETGKLIREIGERGYVTTFTYDGAGKLKSRMTTLPIDPKLLAKIQEKGLQLTALVAKATNEANRQEALRDLTQYYLFDMPDPAKVATLLSQLDHTHAFVILLQQMDINSSLTAADKIKSYQALLNDYPEYKERLQFLINHYKREI